VSGFIEGDSSPHDVLQEVVAKTEAFFELFRGSHYEIRWERGVHRLTSGNRLLDWVQIGLHNDQEIHIAVRGRLSVRIRAKEQHLLRAKPTSAPRRQQLNAPGDGVRYAFWDFFIALFLIVSGP
jgi:hypothetical protein